MRKLLFISTLLISTFALAYNLKLTTILGKVVNNNGGTNGFVIKRTVTLNDEKITAQETWTIGHADLMKLDVEGSNPDGSKWSFEILYKDGKRFTSTIEGGVKSFPFSSEFYEPLLHYRSSKALLSKLVSFQMVPTWAGSSGAQESFVTIDRFKGIVCYMIGAGEAKNTQAPPQIWIDQNEFLTRKIRLGSQIEVEFENYKDYAEKKDKPQPGDKRLMQPDTQTLYWKNSTVTIQNTSTASVSVAKIGNVFKINNGNKAQLPENINLKEFYSRFR